MVYIPADLQNPLSPLPFPVVDLFPGTDCAQKNTNIVTTQKLFGEEGIQNPCPVRVSEIIHVLALRLSLYDTLPETDRSMLSH